jgi:hypothetical protein
VCHGPIILDDAAIRVNRRFAVHSTPPISRAILKGRGKKLLESDTNPEYIKNEIPTTLPDQRGVPFLDGAVAEKESSRKRHHEEPAGPRLPCRLNRCRHRLKHRKKGSIAA